jgi:pilus assembly protein Flp/PilA
MGINPPNREGAMLFSRFLADDSGATAIEYGLICAGIGLLILIALGTTGQSLVAALTLLLSAFG